MIRVNLNIAITAMVATAAVTNQTVRSQCLASPDGLVSSSEAVVALVPPLDDVLGAEGEIIASLRGESAVAMRFMVVGVGGANETERVSISEDSIAVDSLELTFSNK